MRQAAVLSNLGIWAGPDDRLWRGASAASRRGSADSHFGHGNSTAEGAFTLGSPGPPAHCASTAEPRLFGARSAESCVDVSFGLDMLLTEFQSGGRENNHKMTRNPNPQRSVSARSNQVAKANCRDSRAHTDPPSRAGRTVTPTSDRIIKETSAKRRKAMEVLANR